MSVEQVLLALIPGLAQLIESALSSDYDQQAELQAMLNMQRALADARIRAALEAKSG